MVEDDEAWLVDASYRAGKVSLKFIRASDLEPIDWSDTFQPYYLTDEDDPLGVPVQKLDLFTQKTLTLNRVNSFGKAPRVARAWETEISPALSYVYDRGLRFGALHRLEGKAWSPQATPRGWQRPQFDSLFGETEKKDPLKFALVREAYSYATQPVPQIKPEKLGLPAGSEEDYYAAFLLSRIANLPLPQTRTSHSVSTWIRSMLNTYYRSAGILIPNSEELRLGDTREMVEGALTIAPESSNYFNMVVLDFESLFPGCVDVFNLSYETVRCPHPECHQNQVPGLKHWICTKRRGTYSALVGSWRDIRLRLFKPLTMAPTSNKDAAIASWILKLFLVSCYGVTIRIKGLASPLLAESITAYGRHVLRSTWDMARSAALRPRYGDTDSLFLDNPPEKDIIDLVRAVKNRFGLELAHDRFYSVCVLSAAKKAYFGILPGGEPEIKGLAITKSNSPNFFQNTFSKCLSALSVGSSSVSNFELAKKKLPLIVDEAIRELRDGKVSLQDLEYRTRLRENPDRKLQAKTTPQSYQAALLMLKAGKQAPKGTTVGYIKVLPFKTNGRKFTAKPTEQTTPNQINVEDYVRNLRTALYQTFGPMGISLDPMQTTLPQFAQNQSP